MAFEIYINGNYVDPPKEAEAVASFAANILGQIETRNGIYTNTLRFPDTNRNRIAFGNSQQLISASGIPYQRNECIIKDSGHVLVVGFAVLINSKKGFECQIAGGNANWFNSIGNEKLNELNLITLNHKWEDSQVYGRRANVWQLGGNYPNAEYGNFETASTTINFYDLYFGVYAKWIVRYLFETANSFTLSGDFWNNNTTFDKIFIPFSGSWKRDKLYELRNNFYAEWLSDQTAATITGEFDLHTGETSTTPVSDYDFIPSKNFTFTGPFTVTQNRHWLILDSGTVTVNYDLDIVGGGGTPLGQVIDFAYTDATGAVAYANIGTMFGNPPLTLQNFSGTLTFNASPGPVYIRTQECTIKAGSNFELTYEAADEDEAELYITDTFSYITVGSTLPSVSSLDLLRTIWNQFGVIFSTDPQTNVVKTFTLDTVLNNIVNATDWSSKLDLSEEPEISFRLEGYGQTNYWRYQTDDTDEYLFLEQDYGSGSISIGDTTLEFSVDVFVSEFAPIKRIDSFNSTRIMGYIPKWVGGDENTPVPRICLLEFDGDNQLTIGVNPVEPSQPNLYFEDLEFSNLLPIYYSTFSNMVTQPKIVSCLFRLNAIDIANLDFEKPIYVEYFGAYFWLDEVQQYNFTTNKSTMVKLIRI